MRSSPATLSLVQPYVRDFADPVEGLLLQLQELEGFARTVPPLIDASRQSLWAEVMAQPGDPDKDPLDVFGKASGEGTGGGFADFGRTVFVASIALGWEAFIDYLALHLAERERSFRTFSRTTVRDELEERLTRLPFPRLIDRYKEKAGVTPRELEGWAVVEEIQFTRNALIHNHGRYTRRYFNAVTPRFPTKDDLLGFDPRGRMTDTEWKEYLVDREDIPLGFDYVSRSLMALADFAQRIDESDPESASSG